MPCPLFLPGVTLPLSDLFGGACAAEPQADLPLDKLIRCCNPGHARARCPHAAGEEADSIRFLIRSDDGQSIEIAWAKERNHHPLAVGILRVSHIGATAENVLEHQAQACARAYLQGKQ